MELNQLEHQLNRLLQPENFHDFCPDGLIVQASEYRDSEVKKVVTGVSLRKELIDKACNERADVIIVHHPNGWWCSEKDKKIIDSNFANYARMLIKNGISLFGYHLPLDGHNSLGNNTTVAEKLHLEPNTMYRDLVLSRMVYDRFMQDNISVGGEGVITDELLSEVFPKGYQSFNFESGKKYKVAICTGSAALEIEEVYNRGYNLFITGEIRESTPIFAQEHGMAVIAAGHHRSEVFCVQNLAKWINANCPGVEAKFIDIDNPV